MKMEPMTFDDIPDSEDWVTSDGNPISTAIGSNFTHFLQEYIQRGIELYNRAIESHICEEQAELFLVDKLKQRV